ncbi:MAG TPA: biotin/lipoyl-containing protein, partial [Sphingomonas sp.]
LFERDCSLQRRHQKVIEEAPAPGMDEATREQVCAAAVKAAKAVDYVGAGTIEVIADASEGLRADRIWFMEMNTRLQVEHPVTEEITGVDLVEWQLRVASGEPIPKRQEELSINGWAMEARLYAEDPATGFLPSTGKLIMLRPRSRSYIDIRDDFGVEQGDEVTPFYDPMIGKMIVCKPTRGEAASFLAEQCSALEVWPVKTNAPFLARALSHPAFVAGEVTTGFIEQYRAALIPAVQPTADQLEHGALAVMQGEVLPGSWTKTLWGSLDEQAETVGEYTSPWRQLAGFRANTSARVRLNITVAGIPHTVELPDDWRERHVRAERYEDGFLISEDGETVLVSTSRATGTADASAADGAILAPMPGRIIAVDVAEGDAVTKGQRLVTLEAMKMEHALVAPFDGTVAALAASEGGQVTEGTMLARIEAAA